MINPIQPYQDMKEAHTWSCTFCGKLDACTIIRPFPSMPEAWSAMAICDSCINFLRKCKDKQEKLLAYLRISEEK